jgi:hypothetical protein
MQAKWARLILGGIFLFVLAGLVLAISGGSQALLTCAGARNVECPSWVLQLGQAWSRLEAVMFDYNLITIALTLIFFAPGVLGSVALVMRRKATKRRLQRFFEV